MRRSLLAVALVVGVACSSAPVDHTDPLASPTTAEPATTTSSTTTTVPVAPDVQDLMTGTTMTDRGRRLFLAAAPAIEDAATFAGNCGVDSAPASGQPRTHTQGCYLAGRIHLRAPDRPEARELLYVVAAHELLHAAYASLGSAERARVDAQLEAARAGNERLEERLRPYEGSPTLANEIHSILGSEFDGLPPALEAHYAQYFSNRAAVVAARQRTLGAREEEIRRLKAELDASSARIDALNARQDALLAARDIYNYNANIPSLRAMVDRHNAQVDRLNALIDEYNGLLGG